MATLIAVLGTLLGAGIGVAGSYWTQRLSLQAQADERDRASRLVAYSAFLTEVHEMFEQIRTAQRQSHAHGESGQRAMDRVRDVSPVKAQIALERLRFVANAEVADAAAALWEEMRRSDVAQGRVVSRESARVWRDSYWVTRRRLIDAARHDTGREPLDWKSAGVGPSTT